MKVDTGVVWNEVEIAWTHENVHTVVDTRADKRCGERDDGLTVAPGAYSEQDDGAHDGVDGCVWENVCVDAGFQGVA